MGDITEKIKKLRFDKKWSQEELAQKIGVGRQYVSNYETGKMLPSADTLQRLADVFGVSIDYLLSDENKPLINLGLKDKNLIQLFAEVEKLNEDDQLVIRKLLESMIMKNKLIELANQKFN